MSDLFTKAANVKTSTKLWVIGIALLIMVNLPGSDTPSPSAPVSTPSSHSTSNAPLTTPMVVAPARRPVASTVDPSYRNTRPSTSSAVAGHYAGTVHNQTAALSADFAIELHDSHGALSGSIAVKPPLYGSGALTGTVDNNRLTFTVISDIGTIVFTGVHDGEQITGTYTVQHPAGGQEAGSFSLSKEGAIRAVLPPEVMFHAETAVESTNMSPPEKAPVVAEPPKVTPQPPAHSDPKNYSACMNGLSYACKRSLLTSDEAANVQANDLRRNYSSCMNGLSYACNKNLLTSDEAVKVKASDLRRNYSSCMNGLSYACNKALLSAEEATTVTASDLRRNYSSCMNGLTYACNKNLLTPEQLPTVQASDLRRNYSACMNNLSYACNRGLLTRDQLFEVETREQSRRK
jgi:hypothetical protein